MGRVVVDDDVQLHPGVGLRDLFEELQELFVAVPRVAGVGHLAGRDLQRREQRGRAVPATGNGRRMVGGPPTLC